MKKCTAFVLVLSALSFISLSSVAQTLNADTIKVQLLKDWQRAKEYTIDYLNTMPADKYAARPVDSIRSFSEQMLHLAMGNENIISVATGAGKIFKGRNLEKAPGAQSKDSVMYFVTASYDYAINSIKSLDASKLGERVVRGNYSESRLTWLSKAFEHQTHHRGQCTIYIRLQGIRPPNERLF
jgi:uncharacterized damage-inducible protein DinB